MDKVVLTVIVAIAFLFACCFHIRQILIGAKILKSKKYTEEKELKKLLFSGITNLVIETLIIICFVKRVVL